MKLREASWLLAAVRHDTGHTVKRLADAVGCRERQLYRVQAGQLDGSMSPLRILLHVLWKSEAARRELGL